MRIKAENNLNQQIWQEFDYRVLSAIRREAGGQVWNQVFGQVFDQIYLPINNQVRREVRNQVYNQVYRLRSQ
jgi:hypothetical protein